MSLQEQKQNVVDHATRHTLQRDTVTVTLTSPPSKLRQASNYVRRLFHTSEHHQTAGCWNRKRRRPPQYIWCFRPVGNAAIFKKAAFAWVEFEKKNQILLSHQLQTAPTQYLELQDKHIFNNTVVCTVILKEGIAFVLDPEWSKPITYEVICRPKLHWYREFYYNYKHRKMLRTQLGTPG